MHNKIFFFQNNTPVCEYTFIIECPKTNTCLGIQFYHMVPEIKHVFGYTYNNIHVWEYSFIAYLPQSDSHE